MNDPRTIDVHAHVLVPAVEERVRDEAGRAEEIASMVREMGQASVAHHLSLMPEYLPRLTDLSQRMSDMDAAGIDMQVLSISPTQYYYWAESELASRIVDLVNHHIAEICRARPDRFCGLGTVALQHPELAAEQLRYAVVELGLQGCQVSTRAGEMELADDALVPFWEEAEELGAAVFIHPLGCSTMGDRLATHYLSNVIGQPIETTIALSKLIFSGLLDRFEGLTICAAHGGGYLPAYIGRSDHAHAVRPESRTMRHPPSRYLKRLYFDSLVYTPLDLRHLIDRVGADRVVLGTDYPFDMGEARPLSVLDAVSGMGVEERAAIEGGNALTMLAKTRKPRRG